jgi:hypothetical protein
MNCAQCGLGLTHDPVVGGELCPACFWTPLATSTIWPLRATAVSAEQLAELQPFAFAVLELVWTQREDVQMLGIPDTPALYASLLHSQLANLVPYWRFSWPQNASTLLDLLLVKDVGRALPGSMEDFARELALYFFQVTQLGPRTIRLTD